jgi:hypothetical protein
MTLDKFEKAVDRCQELFDTFVDQGTDEELFISSYLSGHFDLIVGQAFIKKNYAFFDLDRSIINSLEAGFETDNLTADEQEKALQLWHRLSSNFEVE